MSKPTPTEHAALNVAERLRNLAKEMEIVGNAIKNLAPLPGLEHALSRGGDMCGAADMAREWADSIERIINESEPNE